MNVRHWPLAKGDALASAEEFPGPFLQAAVDLDDRRGEPVGVGGGQPSHLDLMQEMVEEARSETESRDRGRRTTTEIRATVAAPLMCSVLAAASRLGADRQVLAREAGLPGWTLEDNRMRYPVAQLPRLWQVAAWQLAASGYSHRQPMAAGDVAPVGLPDGLREDPGRGDLAGGALQVAAQ